MHAKLASRAAALSERIFTSLPWGYRIAQVLIKLSDASDYGPAFYAEFIEAGVTGMEDIGGQQALSLQGERGLANRLQRMGYGKNFGHKLYATALRNLKSVEIVEDAIADYFIKLKTNSGGVKLREGTPLETAESYAIKGVIRTGWDILKKKKRERPGLIRRDDSGAETQIDINDPNAFQEFADLLSVVDLEKALREVERFDKRAAIWIRLTLKGWKDKEIAQELGFKHPTQLGELKRKYWREPLQRIFEKSLRQAM
jgi:DNA-directed RNA polymerase specialized sigma24 family protein